MDWRALAGVLRFDHLVNLALVGFALGLGWVWHFSANFIPTRVVFLSVGQGDCTLFQHEGRSVVFDAAGRLEDFDLGERLAAPELRRFGVRQIDHLVITHPDLDHIGGMKGLTKRWKIGEIVASASFRQDAVFLNWLEEAAPGVRVRWNAPGAVLRIGSASITFDAVTDPSLDDNTRSLVAMIRVGAGRAVLTGDATVASEEALAATGDWSAELLKLGHHGSGTSTSTRWLEEVRPKWGVASCGRGNRFGHPSRAVLSRLRAARVQAMRTDESGSIEFRLGSEGFAPTR